MASGGQASDRFVVNPSDNGQALINPCMGWTMHFYSNIPTNYGSKLKPSDTLEWFPGCSTVYLRIPWAYVEPEEGKFDWSILDTPAQRWISKGKRVALRITCSENWMRFATPEWVKNAGAQGVFYSYGKGPTPDGESWDPDFGDPVFLRKLERFLSEMAARYDGNSHVDFVDIGSYGLWGEGHTLASSQVPAKKEDADVRKHIDLYAKYFKRTQLCISDDIVGPETPGRRFPLMDYAISKGVSLRDDSILVQRSPKSYFHAEMAQEFWPKTPVVLEHEHYGSSKSSGAWDGDILMKAVEEYHASYMSIHWWPETELAENKDIIGKINMRMGYRLVPREVSWPRSVKIGERFEVKSEWANAGVAPCYPGGFMALTIKDSSDGIVSVLVDDRFDMRTLVPGKPGELPTSEQRFEFRIGSVAPVTLPGTYGVYLSVGTRDGTPTIALPLDGSDGQRRYKLGTITLVK